MGKNNFLPKCLFLLKNEFETMLFLFFFRTLQVGWVGFQKCGKFCTFFFFWNLPLQTWHFYWLFKVLLKSVTACAHAPELLVDFVLVLRAVASQNQSLFNIRRFNTTIHPREEHGSANLVCKMYTSVISVLNFCSNTNVENLSQHH